MGVCGLLRPALTPALSRKEREPERFTFGLRSEDSEALSGDRHTPRGRIDRLACNDRQFNALTLHGVSGSFAKPCHVCQVPEHARFLT